MKAAAVAVHSFGLGKLAPARHRKDGETPPPTAQTARGAKTRRPADHMLFVLYKYIRCYNYMHVVVPCVARVSLDT
jgi:hypothetical protein